MIITYFSNCAYLSQDLYIIITLFLIKVIEKKILAAVLLGMLFLPLVAAYEESDQFIDKGVQLKNRALSVMMVTGVIIAALVVLAIVEQRKLHNRKRLFFLTIALPIVFATLFTAGTTIYLNQISATKGPVHWHADFEIWNCGKKIDLLNPTGLSNRVGTPVFHEHNDNRIHVEGVVLHPEDVALKMFFNVVGSFLTTEELRLPANEGIVTMRNGELCNGKTGKLQVFVYKVINPEETGNWGYQQEKVENFAQYVLSPYSQVPPGDCIIIEFDEEKEKTNKMCTTYKVAEQRGELRGR